jgi:MYXO-CTERM domain-containing protein
MPVLTAHRTTLSRFAALATCALLCGPSATAGARTCEQDGDCPEHFSCEVTGAIECPPARPCPEGEACDQPADCQPTDYRECVSPRCEDDGDCPGDMVCHEQTVTQCSGSTPGCDPAGECPTPVDAGTPGCTESTSRTCVPRYVPPCIEDSDCGDGFSCDEELLSMCSGGGTGTGGAASTLDGGRANPPESQTNCSTMPTGRFHCVLQPIACTDDGDCPDRFSCEDDPNQASCAVARPAAGDGAGDSAGDGDDGCPDAGPRKKTCLPPYYDLGGGDRGGQQTGSSETGGDASTAQPPSSQTVRKKDSSGCAVSPGDHGGLTQHAALFALLGIALRARSRRRSK